MPESPRDIFERAAARADTELEGLDGRTLRFDIDGHGSWLVGIKGLHLEVAESQAAADVVVTCSEADLNALAGGELNLVTAWMRGEIQMEGDPWLAQRLNSVIRARGYERSQRLSA